MFFFFLNKDKNSQGLQITDHGYNVGDLDKENNEDENYTLPTVNTAEPVQKLADHLQNIQPLIKYGVTRGKPHVDYPAYTEIPETEFNCKQQRYKGFFGDPATGCQVRKKKIIFVSFLNIY